MEQEVFKMEEEYKIKEEKQEAVLYYAFLEIVAKVSEQNDEQAKLLVKVWHQYFDRQQRQVNDFSKILVEEISSFSNRLSTVQVFL